MELKVLEASVYFAVRAHLIRIIWSIDLAPLKINVICAHCCTLPLLSRWSKLCPDFDTHIFFFLWGNTQSLIVLEKQATAAFLWASPSSIPALLGHVKGSV